MIQDFRDQQVMAKIVKSCVFGNIPTYYMLGLIRKIHILSLCQQSS